MSRFTGLLFLLLLTYPFVVQAADALLTGQLVVGAADVPRIHPHGGEPTSGVDGCSKRTWFSIIWACISTTTICTWAAMHPNIPPREGLVKRNLRRLDLMIWAIVAPEIVPAWAFNQWLAAITVSDLYNEKGVFT